MTQYLSTGDILTFDFAHQTANYQSIAKALRRNKLRFQEMELDILDGHGRAAGRKFVTFKAFAAKGKIVWNKYESGAHGAGQNHINIYGRRMKVTEFVALSPEAQDALVGNQDSYKEEKVARKARNAELVSLVTSALEGKFQFNYADETSSVKDVRFSVQGRVGGDSLTALEAKAVAHYEDVCEKAGIPDGPGRYSVNLPKAVAKRARKGFEAHKAHAEAMFLEVSALLEDTGLTVRNWGGNYLSIVVA